MTENENYQNCLNEISKELVECILLCDNKNDDEVSQCETKCLSNMKNGHSKCPCQTACSNGCPCESYDCLSEEPGPEMTTTKPEVTTLPPPIETDGSVLILSTFEDQNNALVLNPQGQIFTIFIV